MSKQIDLQLTGGNNNGDRRELDFYPTPREVTVALLKFLKMEPCMIWEPASGNGAMSNVFKEFGHDVFESDIITGDDYLATEPLLKFGVAMFDAIITNPPFNISNLFIEKAKKEARIVAMLLKSQYWHAKKRVELFESDPPSWVLPLTWRPDFLEHERTDGKKGAPTMEVAWTVWIKGDNITKYKPLLKP